MMDNKNWGLWVAALSIGGLVLMGLGYVLQVGMSCEDQGKVMIEGECT